jgi:hypothetical protein
MEIDAWEIKSFKQAESLAKQKTEVEEKLHIPINHGDHVYPQFDVLEAPAVGDEISRGFNGDYYPCGKIARISKTMKVITSTDGHKFYRRGESSSWVNNGTWSMIKGHHDDKNPHF